MLGLVFCILTKEMGRMRVAQGIDVVEGIVNFLRRSTIRQFWHVKLGGESSSI